MSTSEGVGGGEWLIFEWAYNRMYGPITGGGGL